MAPEGTDHLPKGLNRVVTNLRHTDCATNTLPATYPVEYQICEVLNPTNCDTAIVTVVSPRLQLSPQMTLRPQSTV